METAVCGLGFRSIYWAYIEIMAKTSRLSGFRNIPPRIENQIEKRLWTFK